MHYPDLNPLCLFKLHDNYPETGGYLRTTFFSLGDLALETDVKFINKLLIVPREETLQKW